MDKAHKWELIILGLLSVIVSIGFMGVILMVVMTDLGQKEHDVLFVLMGSLTTVFSQIHAFWFRKNRKGD